MFYKGVKIQSDNEDSGEEKKNKSKKSESE
jgi:hypothetical protein